jgi:hypothetical protein
MREEAEPFAQLAAEGTQDEAGKVYMPADVMIDFRYPKELPAEGLYPGHDKRLAKLSGGRMGKGEGALSLTPQRKEKT